VTWRPLRPEIEPLPESVGHSLSRLMNAWGASAADDVGAVFGHWEDCVGSAVAAHCRPLTLKDGVLLVEVDQPAWATQLRLLSSKVMERITEHCGKAVVSELRVRVGRPSRSG
jgi:predicted nucleic acid-binding Zn ribbon protein